MNISFTDKQSEQNSMDNKEELPGDVDASCNSDS